MRLSRFRPLLLLQSLSAFALTACVSVEARQTPAPDTEGRIERAHIASAKLVSAIESVEGNLGVHTARTHDGVELIMSWFENRDAVLRWFHHPYHRQLLREAGRTEDNIAAEYFGNHFGPILVIASVAYNDASGSLEGSMFEDPDGRRPTRFSVEYYTPVDGGAFFVTPFAPPRAASMIHGLRDVYDDDNGQRTE